MDTQCWSFFSIIILLIRKELMPVSLVATEVIRKAVKVVQFDDGFFFVAAQIHLSLQIASTSSKWSRPHSFRQLNINKSVQIQHGNKQTPIFGTKSTS